MQKLLMTVDSRQVNSYLSCPTNAMHFAQELEEMGILIGLSPFVFNGFSSVKMALHPAALVLHLVPLFWYTASSHLLC